MPDVRTGSLFARHTQMHFDDVSSAPSSDDRESPSLREPLMRLVEQAARTGADEADRVELLQQLLGLDVCRRLGIYRLPADFLLSVVVPVYNEVATVRVVIDRIRATGLPCEIIVVDDGSTDGARELLEELRGTADLKLVFHARNQGKGAALRTGFQHARGDVVVVQDADLEYDPRDFRWLLQPILENQADVVYGSRFTSPDRPFLPLWHLAANRLITSLFCMAHGYRISDVETCYKMFRRELIQEIAATLREERFGVELEITARLLRHPRVRFCERPIRYDRRGYADGKKIGWRDGLRALWCILRY